jgi:hypothetical protein
MTPRLPAVARRPPTFAAPPPFPNAETRQRSSEIGLEVKVKAALLSASPKVLE